MEGHMIDLRSDTITYPTEEMMQAVVEAFRRGEFGDDVYGEDRVVNKLEERAAEIMGREAALFVTSGTQGNLVSLLSQTHPGDEIILEADSHIYWYEVGGFARIGGLSVRRIAGVNGYIPPEMLEKEVRGVDIHFPKTTLVAVENTHNRAGGKVITKNQMKALYEKAKELGLVVHTDGARIFNAAIAQGVPARELAQYSDSVMFCLSKGLSAPIGSMVVGSSEFIKKARKFRKMLGGGMRQVGIIAAAGLWALEHMVDRLQEDHDNAKLLAQGLSKIEGIHIVEPETNIIVFDFKTLGLTSAEFINAMKERGVLFTSFGTYKIRAVTHRQISKDDVMTTIEKVRAFIEER